MKINSGGTGGELLTDFICANSIWKSIPPREGRVKILSSNLMPAHLFSSPVKLKWKKKRERCLGWSCGQGDGFVWSTSIPSTKTLEIGEMAPVLFRDQSLSFGILYEEGTGPVQSPVSRGKPNFTGLWIRVLLTKQRGIFLWSYFHHLNLQCLCVYNNSKDDAKPLSQSSLGINR